MSDEVQVLRERLSQMEARLEERDAMVQKLNQALGRLELIEGDQERIFIRVRILIVIAVFGFLGVLPFVVWGPVASLIFIGILL